MTITTTSALAYQRLKADGTHGVQWSRILRTLRKRRKPMTRRELSVATGIEPGAVAGRVNQLVKDGLVQETEKRRCRISGRLAKVVELA
jgi:predicted ArsR family transcriptional regulator